MIDIRELIRLQKARRVNEWFERPIRYDSSPKCYVEQVVTQFIDATRQFNLTLCISNAQFYRALSRVICKLYDNKDTPYVEPQLESLRKLPKPQDWKLEYEDAWTDYMEYHYFTSDFWDDFWKSIPECHLDYTLYNWRNILTVRLPCFITRDASYLVDDGCINEGGDDEYVEDYVT